MSRSKIECCRNDSPIVRERVTPIYRVQAKDQINCAVLGLTVEGFDVHWCTDHSEPCLRQTGKCDLCDRKVPQKWFGYLFCFDCTRNEAKFVELTDHAYKRVLKLCPGRENLRGLLITFSRERGNIKAPVQVALLGEAPPTVMQLKSKSVVPTLLVTWKKYL